MPVGFAFQVVASTLPGLSHLPELRLVTELVHSVGRPFVARAGKIRRLDPDFEPTTNADLCGRGRRTRNIPD